MVSTYGESNAIQRADVKVENGKVTDATLHHRAAKVTLKLVASAGGEAFASRIPKWAILSRLAAPANDRMPARIAEYEVSLQLGRLGLALEDFRSRAGNYPATLQQLDWTDAAITDPFTGQPFVYRPDGDNVLVYSVGIDRADDGGLYAPRKKLRDIVWRVERGGSW